MISNRKMHVLLLLLIVFACYQVSIAQTAPRVFLLDAKALVQAKEKISSGDKAYLQALDKLKAAAQKSLKAEKFSIVVKEGVPPSGDKHDYMSQAPYFWKNPNTPNGLPYIRRDGERNPEIKKYPDHDLLDNMVDAVETLARAYYFTGDEAYAEKARSLLHAWFIAPETKMNPNMQFAQAVPGESTGRVFGVLESRGLIRVIDSIGLLENSQAWSTAAADRQSVKEWFSQFLEWLMTSKNGRGEGESANNHGTLYDVQIVSYALFLGKNKLAAEVLETAKKKRITRQIDPNGKQPLELERTKSWNYSTMNLEGLMWLAKLGENAGVDLWTYQTTDGRGIRQALDYLYPFAIGEKKWEYQQIEGWQPQRLFPLMRLGARHYTDEKFKAMMSKIPAGEIQIGKD